MSNLIVSRDKQKRTFPASVAGLAKNIADKHKHELGFVNIAALKEAEEREELEVIDKTGFVHFHHRRDNQTTIYEIATIIKRQGWGRLLFYRVLCSAVERGKKFIVAKCPEDLPSNGFYQKLGFKLAEVESGKKRRLNKWRYEIKLPLLFYCADGGRNEFGRIAITNGWMPGLRSTETDVDTHVCMVDNHWTEYNHEQHLERVKKHKPLICTARDIEYPEQLPEILKQAKELAQYSGRVLLIPKCRVPLPVNYWLAYSVPSGYGKTDLPCSWFGDRPIHLLGGSPRKQEFYSKHLNVVSLDGNYAMRTAQKFCKTTYISRDGKRHEYQVKGGCYKAFEISMREQSFFWHPSKEVLESEQNWKWEEEPLFKALISDCDRLQLNGRTKTTTQGS